MVACKSKEFFRRINKVFGAATPRTRWLITIGLSLIGFADAVSQDTLSVYYKTVYKSNELVVTRLSRDVYMHTSYFDSETFGRVPCNGMIVIRGKESVVFDTPATEAGSSELIAWLKKTSRNIKAVISTHFHIDCVGGLDAFHRHNVPSYASQKTIELTKANEFKTPLNGFTETLELSVGNAKVYAAFFGEGHTIDNVVGYYSEDNVLFGGCLIKSLGSGKGNLEDANVNAWSETVERVQRRFPGVKIVIPGHGRFGDAALLDYTVKMFGNLAR